MNCYGPRYPYQDPDLSGLLSKIGKALKKGITAPVKHLVVKPVKALTHPSKAIKLLTHGTGTVFRAPQPSPAAPILPASAAVDSGLAPASVPGASFAPVPNALPPLLPSSYYGLPGSPMEHPGATLAPDTEAVTQAGSGPPWALLLGAAGVLLLLSSTRKGGR